MRINTLLAVTAAAALALVGCAEEDTPDDVGTTASGAEDDSPTEAPTEAEPEVFRESIGLFQATDPAMEEFDALLSGGGTVALDLTLSIQEEQVELTGGSAGNTTLWFIFEDDADGSLGVGVPEAALTLGNIEEQEFLSTLRGVFDVETSSQPDVEYELVLDEDLPEFDGRDEERCRADGTEEEFLADADLLIEDPGAYAEVRERWADSPQLWWAVKATAHSLETYGDVSDSMATACAPYF